MSAPHGIRVLRTSAQSTQIIDLETAVERDRKPVERPARLAFTANLRSDGEDRPGLHVTDMIVPYPFSSFDQEMWGRAVFGTTPLALAGLVTASGEAVVWSPTTAIRVFLVERLFAMLEQLRRGDRVLPPDPDRAAIADSRERDRRMANGLTLGMPRDDGGTDMELPSIDDVRGADFTLWSRLVRSIIGLVVVPARTGLLRLKTARDALGPALPRAELSHLPAGVQVAPGDPDPYTARRLADRAFRDRPQRRLVFVVDERYTDAAEVIREALGGLDVELELIDAAEPAAAAQARRGDGEPLGGVLTRDAAAETVTGLGGFTEAIEL